MAVIGLVQADHCLGQQKNHRGAPGNGGAT